MDGTQKYGVYMGPPTGEWKISAANNKNPEVLWAWFKWYHSKPCAELFVKDGHGMVIWPELNKEEYFSLQVQKDYARLDNEWNFVNPQPSLRNPECAYVSDGMGTPDETAITTGVFSDQITQDMLRATLDTLNDQKDQSLLDNIAAAQAEGHDVTFEDWVFPDWDPLKDYVTERKS
jgi:multiple sugar transport system substrate-binding protein